MILRRFTKHVTEQNWFAVGLDVLVVITGIFLGMQVTAWNEVRNDRIDEQQFLKRLHNDLLNTSKLSERLLDRRLGRVKEAYRLADVLFSRIEQDRVSVEECRTISSLHYFNVVIADLGSVKELAATGRMAIIDNPQLLNALVGLSQARDAVNQLMITQQSVTYDLASRYADLIQRDARYNVEDGEVHSLLICDIMGIRKNRKFLNEFSANMDAYDAFILDALGPWATQFSRVHKLVDKELNFKHEDSQ